MAEILADDGTRLHVAIHGPAFAPPLVLLHSLGCDHSMWAGQIALLKQRYRVIAPDIRGHGRSAVAGPITLQRLGADALCVLDQLDVPVADACGLSLGGIIVQFLAIHAPSRLRRIVLANTASRIGSEAAWRERADTVRQHGMATIAEAVMQRFFGQAFRSAHRGTVEEFRARLISTSPEGYAGCCEALEHADLTAALGSITAPTLVIAGSQDISTPPDQLRALAAAIPGAALVELDTAHLSAVEQPALFTKTVAGHLHPEGSPRHG